MSVSPLTHALHAKTTITQVSGLHYFGKLDGDNNLRKAKAWLGTEWLKKVRDLQVSEFLVQYGPPQVGLQKMPYYQSLSKPQEFTEEMVYQYSNRKTETLREKSPCTLSIKTTLEQRL